MTSKLIAAKIIIGLAIAAAIALAGCAPARYLYHCAANGGSLGCQ